MSLAILIIISFIIIATFGGVWFWRKAQKRRHQQAYEAWKTAQQYTVLKILVPRLNEKTPLAAEQFLSALHGVFRESSPFQYQISFEIATINMLIHFYVRTPTHLKEFIEGQLYAQYPDVQITQTEDYPDLIDVSGAIVGTELSLTKDDVYPIKTFINFEVDPLSAITGVLSGLGEGQNLMLQCIVRPISDEWQKKGVDFAKAKRSGQFLEEAPIAIRIIAKVTNNTFGLVLKFLQFVIKPPTAASATSEGEESKNEGKEKVALKLSAPEEAGLKAIEEKINKLGFATKIRIVATAADSITARQRVESLTGAFKQFNAIHINGFKAGLIVEGKDIIDRYRQRQFDDEGFILNIEELASFYHFPSTTVQTPNILWSGSKKGEPPADLAIEGRADPSEVTFFGITDFRNFRHKFGIKLKDRNLHTYAIGKTGTGKSTMLMNMITDDIIKGRGVAVVDPHGQLIADVMEQIPAHRIDDVVYFNPADRDFPIGFNVLESISPDLKNIIVSGVVGIFKKLWADSWGPRLEYILRNAMLALMEYPDSTLLDVMRLLVDKDFRKNVLDQVSDPVVKDFFVNEYNRWQEKFRLESIQSIQNKVGQFLSASTIRNIVGQPKSTINIRKIMDERKIMLVDLSVGKIGEDTSTLLGAMMITKMQLEAMSRANVPEDQRPDFYLYVDEFQNFATESFAVILSEARKYHLNLILTNQYIAQMPPEVENAIFGNVGTIVSFRVGATDASSLIREFEPVFDANDLVNLGNYHVYIKMSVDGVTRAAFSAKTLPPIHAKIGLTDEIIKASRLRYSQDREKIEQSIKDWSAKIAFSDKSLIKMDDLSPGTSEAGEQSFKDKRGQDWFYEYPKAIEPEVKAVPSPTETEQDDGPKAVKRGILSQSLEEKQAVFNQEEDDDLEEYTADDSFHSEEIDDE